MGQGLHAGLPKSVNRNSYAVIIYLFYVLDQEKSSNHDRICIKQQWGPAGAEKNNYRYKTNQHPEGDGNKITIDWRFLFLFFARPLVRLKPWQHHR